MSAATKRKYVTQEFLEELVLPDPDKRQEIVQVVSPRGNNLHEVQNASGDRYLVSMPPKFRKSIWIKRGDFVLVDPIAEGDRVKGEISHVIRTKDQIAYLRAEGKWPTEFDKSPEDTVIPPPPPAPCHGNHSITDSDDESDLSPNLNRRSAPSPYDSEKETSSDEDDD